MNRAARHKGNAVRNWWPFSEELLWWLGIASAVMFVATLAGIPWLIARMRADYFVRIVPPPRTWWGRHPAVRLVAHVLKNALGALLVLAGIAMLVLPGQGILTILIGVILLDFPGKRQLELWLVRRNGVLAAINWIRRKSHKPPLKIPAEGAAKNANGELR